jgi:hypothetical protein
MGSDWTKVRQVESPVNRKLPAANFRHLQYRTVLRRLFLLCGFYRRASFLIDVESKLSTKKAHSFLKATIGKQSIVVELNLKN